MAIIDPRNPKFAILETNNRKKHIYISRTFEKLWKMTIFEFWVHFWHQKCQKVKILQIILVKISQLVPKVLRDFFLIFRHPPSTSLNLLLVLRGFFPLRPPTTLVLSGITYEICEKPPPWIQDTNPLINYRVTLHHGFPQISNTNCLVLRYNGLWINQIKCCKII